MNKEPTAGARYQQMVLDALKKPKEEPEATSAELMTL